MALNWNSVDEAWRQRHDPEAFDALETELDRELYHRKTQPEYALLWRWSRLSHFRAMQEAETGNVTAARRHFAAGAEEAAAAAKLQPNRAEGHFWHGVCHIEAASATGKLSALRALGKATASIDRAIEIDEAYHFAGPLRVKARIADKKPRLLGGDREQSLSLYRRALEVAPNNSTTLLMYAECLLANRQRSEVPGALQQIIGASDDDDWLWEQRRDRRRAAALLQKMVGKS